MKISISTKKAPAAPPAPKKYPDTQAGAIACLKADADKRWVAKLDLPNCKIHADPSVEGVWAIDSMKTGQRTIVYLAGYKEPFGSIRDYNDFESGGLPMSMLKPMVQQGSITLKQLKQWNTADTLDDEDYRVLVQMYKDYNE